jgi:hypothetical protein
VKCGELKLVSLCTIAELKFMKIDDWAGCFDEDVAIRNTNRYMETSNISSWAWVSE